MLFICGTTNVDHVEAEQMAWLPVGNGCVKECEGHVSQRIQYINIGLRVQET